MTKLALWSCLAALLLSQGGCADNEGPPPSVPHAPFVDPRGAGGTLQNQTKLPASIAATRKIRVGSDMSYPPLEWYAAGETKPQGFDVDLCDALANKLGSDVTCRFQNGDFDHLLDDLAADKVDIVMSAMTDNKARQAKADFVDYLMAGMSLLIRKDNPLAIKSLGDLCGSSIGAQEGTTEEIFAKRMKGSCSGGARPMNVVTVKSDAVSMAMLRAGWLAGDLEDFPAAAHEAKTSGGGNDFELFGAPTDAAPYGIAIKKSDTELRDALSAAMKGIVEDGTYAKLLTKWNLEAASLAHGTINGG